MSEATQTKRRLNLLPLFAIGFLAFVSFFCFSLAWPPVWIERRSQRQKVIERVQSAGGWDALKRDCLSLTQTNEWFRWVRWGNNSFSLPPTLTALRPQEVDYISPKLLTPNSNKPKAQIVQTFHSEVGSFALPELSITYSNKIEIAVVRIQIFGAHSTGGHSTPYFGLEIICGPEGEDYRPRAARGASGNSHTSYRKIEEGIYEVY